MTRDHRCLHTEAVEPGCDDDAIIEPLHRTGAVFALVFGSRAQGDARGDSDLDVAAW